MYVLDNLTVRRPRRRLPFAATAQLYNDKVRRISNCSYRDTPRMRARVARCYQRYTYSTVVSSFDGDFVSESPIENLNGWALEKLSLLSGVGHANRLGRCDGDRPSGGGSALPRSELPSTTSLTMVLLPCSTVHDFGCVCSRFG
jgi:hypothetical protein